MREVMLVIALLGGSFEAGRWFNKQVMDTQRNIKIVIRRMR